MAQSGGPTCTINATLAGCYKKAIELGFDNVYGALYGVQGLLDSKIIDLKAQIKTDEDLNRLKITPASALGSCRYKVDSEEKLAKIVEILKSFNINYFIYIGGNDSMDTVYQLSKYIEKIGEDIHVMGSPKTIDNDLFETDHTPGFGSAAKFVANSVYEIAKDVEIYDYRTITIVEIMGRYAGWLTAAGAISKKLCNLGADLVYISEDTFEFDNLVKEINENFKRTDNILILVSEGIKDSSNNFISKTSGKKDKFGHAQLQGPSHIIRDKLKEIYDMPIRSIELNILQRCDMSFVSKTDIEESFEVGEFSVECVENHSGKMVGIKRISNKPYKTEFELVDIEKVANKTKMIIPKYTDSHFQIDDEFMDYILPLIEGEIDVEYKNGIAQYFAFDKEDIVKL
ncbi:MAG: diphosphate--fructose-6-phosphate 1-phosphotransferase [Finegoldia magna]|nr:diphosphate--fructose-6-phosphate 1-phosphotransferase [Finegoldia magna]MBS5966899.1 diphosphate--fructose-6-phosphate 1-phosphotransferase [Finegoldia magna]